MEYANLGNTDIKVSRVCIGGMSFGKVFPDFHQWVIDQPATQAVIKRALELGVNFIDTANCYSHGTSEEFIGESLRNLDVELTNDEVVFLEEPYQPHELVGPLARPGEKRLTGTNDPTK